MFDKFAADFPAGPHNRWGQADLHFQYASLLRKLNRSEEAEQAYRRAIELSDKLVNDFPKLPGYPETAVDRRRHLAQFLLEARRPKEAQQVYEEASTILEKLAAPEKAKALKARAHFYASLGEWVKAADDFTKAIELGSDDVVGIWFRPVVSHLSADRTAYGLILQRLYRDAEELIKKDSVLSTERTETKQRPN